MAQSIAKVIGADTVSYTHLDVYKRQLLSLVLSGVLVFVVFSVVSAIDIKNRTKRYSSLVTELTP